MGRLIYSFNVSLDGYIETVDKSLDWSLIDPRGPRLLQRPDAGARCVAVRPASVGPHERVLADRRAGPDATPYMREFAQAWNATPKFVFSRTLEHAEHGARIVRGDVGEELAKVRREFDGDLEVGGANLAAQFIERGLVDEYRLMIHPVAIGGGTPFWPAGQRRSVRETGSRTFSNGCRLLTYVPA